MVEKVFRKREVKRFYGDPPNSTFHDRIKSGLIPAPDFQLGPRTPGWTEGLIARDQNARLNADRRGR